MRATCGTYGGYQSHMRRAETACEPCRQARNAYARSRRSVRPVRQDANRRQAARMRAFRRLAAEFPERFSALFDRELAR